MTSLFRRSMAANAIVSGGIWPKFKLIQAFMYFLISCNRRDVPVGVPLDLSTPTGMSCIGTYGENCKSDNVSKYRVLLVAFLLL